VTVVAQSAPNSYTVSTDSGTAIGTIILSPAGFTAMVAGKVVGVFSTMSAAISAITGSNVNVS
jgi:hypothetical protein